MDVDIVATAIKDGRIENAVKRVREVYHLMSVHRQPDGQITTNWVVSGCREYALLPTTEC